MAKDYSAEELAEKLFLITMIGVGLFVAAVFLFIL
jgi:hypothetical protein